MWNNATDRDSFVDFLLQAKRSTYAGEGDEATATPLVPGSKQLEYQDGDYFYRDIYLGMAYFVGQEVVSYRGHPLWSMSYAGGVTPPSGDRFDPRAIYGFLRLALRHGIEAEPYRGPASFRHESWAYTNSSSGSLDAFWGIEKIVREGAQVYECRYAGGVLR
jgi:hypothetical protein